MLAERTQVKVAARSHPGMSGKNNEDRYAVSTYRLPDENATPAVLAIVSDGIGGHRAGEVAAEIAVETISQVVTDSNGEQQEPVEVLREAIIQASHQIYEQSEQDSAQRGMGATCACGWIIGDRLYTATVGDSRIYLLRGNTIRQLSTDHTWIQEAIENGAITPDQARGHPNAHVIRRYLGSRQPVIPDLRLRLRAGEEDEQAEANQGLSLQPGDIVLLCSDGLTDLVNETEILAILKQTADPEAAVDELVGLANKRGGHDNITVVALQMPPAEVVAAATQQLPVARPQPERRLGWACLGAGTLLLVAGVLAVGGFYLFFMRPAEPTITATASASPTRVIATAQPGLPLPGTVLPTLRATQPLETDTATPTASPTFANTRTPTITPTVGITPTRTVLSATLTPWPTNTTAP